MTSPKRTVFIYAKPPVIGLSKTRLAKGIGATEAQRIARWSFEITLRAAKDTRWKTVLATTPDAYLTASLGGLWPKSLERMSQGNGDLTERLELGLAAAANGQVIFIGADCPDISNALLAKAFEQLKKNDVVFGPASDGGFWLFGMNKRAQTGSPFKDVRWSTKYALSDVRDNLFDRAKIAYLPELSDIDTASDWQKWKDGEGAQPQSSEVVSKIAETVRDTASKAGKRSWWRALLGLRPKAA